MRPSSATSDLFSDPFQERLPAAERASLRILGAQLDFESNSLSLLELALSAFKGLPPHRLPSAPPRLRIRLLLVPRQKKPAPSEPPGLAMFSAGGMVGGATEVSDFIVVSPRERTALVTVSERMLRYPYHTRYELIEFTVYTLVARVLGLVSLHGACVGQKGRGVLLLGSTGAGKSTVALQCLLQGLDFLAEDSLFVEPRALLATAASNFMHVRSEGLRWVDSPAERSLIRESPVIRRRSGIRKFEVDLRRTGFRLAPRPLRIVAVVFLSAQSAEGGPLLSRLPVSGVRSGLTASQAYGAGQPHWPVFLKNVLRVPAFELRRNGHPRESVDALRGLLTRGG